jgi:hypothetical protein
MSTVSTTEILGSDSISGSRITINSNFLILQNWINGYISVFGVDSTNGILDLTTASTGKVMAKIGAFNSLSIPSSGVPTAVVNSAGQSSFASVTTTSLTASGNVTFNGTVTFGSGSTFVVGGTASFNGSLSANAALVLGPIGHIVSQNTIYQSGLTAGQAFPDNTLGGGGVTGSLASPYAITGLEDVIYADCSGSGFFMKVVDGSGGIGATAANIASGTRLTIINTSSSAGLIQTGVQEVVPVVGPKYYTGFNTDPLYGGFPSGGITISSGYSYRSSISLQWEPRVALGQATENGSWVVLSATNMTV